MKPKYPFKAGDVISYWGGSSHAIVNRVEGDIIFVDAWFHQSQGYWDSSDRYGCEVGRINDPTSQLDIKLHPDGERIWVEYVAWRLTQ